jgi:predicted O-methyltransferase YrrM
MLITEFAASRRRVIRMRSVVAATHYKNESLDFVFLDADHNYEAVQADIAAWLPKVRPGGILCGHDYANEAYPLWGVARAVDEAFGPQVELGKNYTWRIRVGTSTQSVKEIS